MESLNLLKATFRMVVQYHGDLVRFKVRCADTEPIACAECRAFAIGRTMRVNVETNRNEAFMALSSRSLLICCSFFVVFGCSASDPVASKSHSHEEACNVILDYLDQYEQTHLQYEGAEMYNRLAKVETEYHNRMSALAQQGKWTPSKEMGTDMKLYFLIDQFHGAVQSCKIERSVADKDQVGCNQAHELRNKAFGLLGDQN